MTELLHMLTGRTREEIYNNLDGMLAHYAGRPVPIDEARTTIGQWWRNGLMVREGNQIKREFRDAVLSGDQQRADQLYERLDRIVGYVDSNNVTTGNWFADSAVKPFLEMVPRLADPIFQGATLNLATQAAIVGVASLFGAPVSGGATLAGLPYALGLAAAAGPATGMVASSMEWADQIHADQFYQLYSMTDAEGNRMDPHIISAVMWPLAGVSALVETVQM
ncbi:MAG: hypothetical protein U9R15_20015, partial [Chloroflexota bacterium]|nr:hypothetical protein [Chloroflexota bacterium]